MYLHKCMMQYINTLYINYVFLFKTVDNLFVWDMQVSVVL